MKIFCVIPAYNEGENIARVINDIRPSVDRIIVVDDASCDQTFQVARKCGAICLRHIINRGQGAALKTGTVYSLEQGADIIIHYDADGQFNHLDIPTILEPLINSQADIVFGSRFLEKNPQNMPWLKKKFIMPLARLINYIFFKIELTDPQSGFRAMSSQAARKINWHNDRMAHCSEILYLAHAQGLRIKEVPVDITYHEFGQNLGGGLKILKDLFIAALLK